MSFSSLPCPVVMVALLVCRRHICWWPERNSFVDDSEMSHQELVLSFEDKAVSGIFCALILRAISLRDHLRYASPNFAVVFQQVIAIGNLPLSAVGLM